MSVAFRKLIAVTVAGAAVIAASAASAEDVKLGFLGGFTGPIETLVPPIHDAAALAVKHVNDQGGILGGQLSMVQADSTCIDATAASNAADRLVNAENVTALVGPLCSGEKTDDDEASGTIYVLRSKSDHPVVDANRDLVHKIGVTNSDVEQRIAGARLQPTFLMADVEIVATYRLFNISRTRLENLIHRVFEPARLEIEIKDRFGRPVVPREWFLVPLFVVDEAVEKIKDGTITEYVYDPGSAALKRRG